MNNKSEVLENFQQLLELEYTGTTPENYVGYVSDFLDFSSNVPDRVTNNDVLSYNIYLCNFSYSYRNCALSAIKAYFRLYLKRKIKGLSFKRPKKQFKQPKVIDAYALSDKIKSIENKKHKAILALGLSGWLRRSEVINLKITDIDSDRMRIKINQSKGAKDREVELSESTLKILRDYVREYRPTEYLFNGQKKAKYSGTSINNISHKFLGCRFHCLRASGSTFALANGTDIKTISEILGHSKIQTTRHYIPTLYQNIKQAI